MALGRALSPSGEWAAWADQFTLHIVDVKER
jgi:hypothetical protein